MGRRTEIRVFSGHAGGVQELGHVWARVSQSRIVFVVVVVVVDALALSKRASPGWDF